MKKVINGLKWFLDSYIWLFIIFLVTDIVTKQLVLKATNATETVCVQELIPGFLRISCLFNEQAAFGFGTKNALADRIIYIVIASIAVIGIVIFFIKKYKEITPYVKACINLILVGAVGNLIDRLFYAASNYAVVDWIDFYGIWGFNFNIADSCVVVGAIMLMVWLIIEEVKSGKDKDEEKVVMEVEPSFKDEVPVEEEKVSEQPVEENPSNPIETKEE